MKSRPFRPTATTRDDPDWSSMNWAAARLILLCSPPVRPLSGVMSTTDVFSGSLRCNSGCSMSSSWGCAARSASRLRILSEYGLPRRAISWARRIFDAAIIDIALVILAVFSTLRMRRLMSLTLGMCPS